MRGELRPPFVLGDVGEREPEPLPLDAHDDQTEAGPAVKPLVEQSELRGAGRQLKESQGSTEATAGLIHVCVGFMGD
jgi:hypothetical protein